MSWQDYVDTNLLGTKKVSRAAILGLAGGVWATSAGFEIKPEEQKTILDGLKNTDHATANGVRVAGQKYFIVQTTDRSLYGKKGADGIVIVKTKQAVLVALYDHPLQAGEATPVAEGLADYLISVGY